MIEKMKGQRYTMQCIEIRNAVKTRNTGYIHLVKFMEDDGDIYTAEEYEASPTSKFILDKKNIFELTNPGHNGYPDWIRFVSLVNNVNPHGNPNPQESKELLPIPKDDLIIAQVAFQKAVELAIKHGWNEEMILDRAYYFAGNIKKIARQISEEKF